MSTAFRLLACLVGVAVLSVHVEAQTRGNASAPSKAARTAWGHPDLQGRWSQNIATPLERPKSLAGRERLTEAELNAIRKSAAELLDADAGDAAFADQVFEAALAGAKNFTSSDAGTGNYNHFWLADRDFDDRTSLVTDPPDGRIPALSVDAQTRQTAAAEARKIRPADGPEDRNLFERCITAGFPRLLAGYNSNYQILQTPTHVAIVMEMIHDVRIIPLDGRPHLKSDVQQWHGDSRGRWDGDTLVVETRNFSPKANFRGSSSGLHLVERFTRVSPSILHYEFTATDPSTWTKPWTAMIPLRETQDLLYEYACHEGNLGMVGILSGHRSQEKAVAQQSAKD